MDGGRKKKWRVASDLAAVYGIDPGQLDYSGYVGLTLNLSRHQSRHAFAVAQGVAVAFGQDVSASFFEGVTDTPEQAREMAEAATRKRQWAAALRKFRGGGR